MRSSTAGNAFRITTMSMAKTLEKKTGVVIFSQSSREAEREASHLESICHDNGVAQYTDISIEKYADIFLVNLIVTASISETNQDCDTMQMSQDLLLDSENSNEDSLIETLLSMAISPVALIFPSHQELQSSIRMRLMP